MVGMSAGLKIGIPMSVQPGDEIVVAGAERAQELAGDAIEHDAPSRSCSSR